MSTIQENGALVNAYLAGDQRAFDQLFFKYAGRLLHFIHRMIGDWDRAEDLVQEAFVRVHRHLPGFDQSRQFSTWLYTIGANLAKNELRNRKRSPVLLTSLTENSSNGGWLPMQLEDSRNRPDTLYHRRYLADLVSKSVSRLSERHREVFVMRELEGRSYEEIAQLTRTNLGTVKSRLNRARQCFTATIEPYLD